MIFTESVKAKLFHPINIVLISFAAALLYSVYATLRFSGDKLSNQYYYVVPIVVPFVIFLLTRFENFRQKPLIQSIIDAVVVLTAVWRVIGDVPYVSGHALFLTYCLLTIEFNVGRILAAIVLLEVLYLKLFVWHDWLTCFVGITLGIIAAIIYQQTRNF